MSQKLSIAQAALLGKLHKAGDGGLTVVGNQSAVVLVNNGLAEWKPTFRTGTVVLTITEAGKLFIGRP